MKKKKTPSCDPLKQTFKPDYSKVNLNFLEKVITPKVKL